MVKTRRFFILTRLGKATTHGERPLLFSLVLCFSFGLSFPTSYINDMRNHPSQSCSNVEFVRCCKFLPTSSPCSTPKTAAELTELTVNGDERGATVRAFRPVVYVITTSKIKAGHLFSLSPPTSPFIYLGRHHSNFFVFLPSHRSRGVGRLRRAVLESAGDARPARF